MDCSEYLALLSVGFLIRFTMVAFFPDFEKPNVEKRKQYRVANDVDKSYLQHLFKWYRKSHSGLLCLRFQNCCGLWCKL